VVMSKAPTRVESGKGGTGEEMREVYRDTADVRVPYLGVEPHGGRLEWIRIRDNDIDLKLAASINRVRRPGKGALQVGETGGIDRLGLHARVVSVLLYIRQLLQDPTFSGGRHCPRCN